MKPKLAWGILGTGMIARKFARALAESKTGRLHAVGSRAQATADRFGDEFQVPRRHGSYEAFLADPEIDAVYISLPNHLHLEWSVRCAEAGKHILCEKPLAVNHGEAGALVEAARRQDVFLMEAFMYRCHPQTARLAKLIREGVIGEVRMIQAHFSYQMGPKFDNIRLQNEAAGGGIMDVGCYCASMSRLVAGAALGQDFADPVEVKGTAVIGNRSRIDEWATAVLQFPGNILANLTCGCQVGVDSTLRIYGSAGNLLVPNPWFPGKDPASARILVNRPGQPSQEIAVPSRIDLYAIEADVLARHLADRQAPAPCMTWADSLGNMKTLDRWRQSVGLVFECEKRQRRRQR